jgi:hypothetical protein
MITIVRPRLPGAGSIAGSAVDWGLVWSDLVAVGHVAADAEIKLPE